MRTGVNSALAQIYSDIQGQGATAFTTSGATPAFVLTPAPALTAYAVGQRFSVTFNASGTTGSNTLNVSGLGAKNLKQLNASGTKTAAAITTGQIVDVVYDGTDFVLIEPLLASTAVAGIIALASNAQALGGTDNANALTSAALASSNSPAGGVVVLPGGIRIMWGKTNYLSNGNSQAISLSGFTTAVVPFITMLTPSANSGYTGEVTAYSTYSITVYNGSGQSAYFSWFVIGY
jgi:hypothetical protein